MGGWVEANTLVRHKGRAPPGQTGDTVRNDPNSLLSMYRAPPAQEVSLLEFEECALARLRGAMRGRMHHAVAVRAVAANRSHAVE
jgi:hypothetical protein